MDQTSISRPDEPDTATNTGGDAFITVRTDAWTGPCGGFRALLAFASGDRAQAFLVARSGVDQAWTFGRCMGGLDLMDADRDAFVPALDMTTLRQEMLECLGVFATPNLRALVWEIAVAALHLRTTTEGNTVEVLPDVERPYSKSPTVAQSYDYGYKRIYDKYALRRVPVQPVAGLGVPDRRPQTERRRTFRVNQGELPSPVPHHGDGIGARHHDSYVHERVIPFLDPWHGSLRTALKSHRMDFSGLIPWSSHMHAYVSATGTVDRYRSQALALYPFLGPVLAAEPSVLALIDVGRPFEPALVHVLDRWADLSGGPGYSMAKLRRLRGIKMDHLSINGLCDLIRVTARIQPCCLNLLETPLGRVRLSAIEEWTRHVELDGADLFRDAPPTIFDDVKDNPPLRGIIDMAERCAKTLVMPFVQRAFDPLSIPDYDQVSINLLMGGLTFRECLALEKRWHAGLGPFEARLPVPKDVITWPALFEPYSLDDVRITCLTRQDDLRREGATGLDADGEYGLGHCIGGYGPQCFTGTVHVASVRVREGKKWRRLSSVAFSVDGGKVSISEHSGRLNAKPPLKAVQAVASLLSDIEGGTVPTNPEAHEKRSAGGYHDGIDWTLPGNLEASLSAWRPFLPAWAAEADVATVIARIDALQHRFQL